MKTSSLFSFVALVWSLSLLPLPSQAQVPQMINYQGRLTAQNVNFDGAGQFKFAVVNNAGTTTYWSNDGSSAAGSEPGTSVTLPVNKGSFAVLLGDTALAHMNALPSSVFNNGEVYVRVWFNDNVNGFQRLTPDIRIAAVGYAMKADSALTVPDGTITSSMIANGAVGTDQLAPGAALANLQADGQTGVPSGGVVLSPDPNSSALLGAGYVKIGSSELGNAWEQRASGNAPGERWGHTAVWTGTELIVWGGTAGGASRYYDGARFNPAANAWVPVTVSGAPGSRMDHTAVWTGTEMIIWGGTNSAGSLQTGSRYNPVTDSWTATSTTAAPAARARHTAVWTGRKMIIWGGENTAALNSGAIYDPAVNTWTAVNSSGAPAARTDHTAVWTGTEMIVWGGGTTTTGGRYNPSTDSWTATSTTGVPHYRTGHTAVWTGTEMVIWGGSYSSGLPATTYYLNVGGRYNPSTDSWTATSTTGVPGGRRDHTAIWTGTEMIIWGGYYYSSGPILPGAKYVRTGGRYNPATDTWLSATTLTGAPDGRRYHTAVWTGTDMIVWGGSYSSTALNSGGRYNLLANSWSDTRVGGAPSARFYHTAIWTGNEMIIWGGYAGGANYLNTGSRYHSALNSWTATSAANAPAGRAKHTAVWTGSEMIVWAGTAASVLNTGARYNPSTDTWTTISTAGAPVARYYHSAVWSGNEMIIWGGALDYMTGTINTGGRYNPLTDTWTATSIANAPADRYGHVAVWTGSKMVVWGGDQLGAAPADLNTGGRYDPLTDSWQSTSLSSAPTARHGQTAVWTGSKMIVWGGHNSATSILNTGGCYDPTADTWVATATSGAPAGVEEHTAIWTGAKMVVWGGESGPSWNTGGIYDPVGNTWTATTTSGAPVPRYSHTAVWTGSEMLVFGGCTGAGTPMFDTLYSYSPPRSMTLYQKP